MKHQFRRYLDWVGKMTSGYEIKEIKGERDRLVAAFSRYGYTPQTALADIIDNSLSANATLINVDFSEQSDGTWKVYISDNGTGMSPTVLEKAVAFGSPRELQRSALSKYGFGMKTASLEVSPEGFTVLSRGGENKETSAISLFKKHQVGSGSPYFAIWNQEDIDPTWVSYLDKTAGPEGTGTVVIWEWADLRAADIYKKASRGDKTQMKKRIENRISTYLGKVFHRWISGDDGVPRQVIIKFRDEPVEPWNPLDEEWLDAEQVEPIEPQTIQTKTGEVVDVELKVWVARKDIPKKVAEEVVRKNAPNQGIYLYRMNRIINDASWFGLVSGARAPLNGLRFSLDVDPKLDEEIHLDVKKAQSDLPDQIVDYIRPHVDFYVRSEEERANLKRRDANKQLTPLDAIEAAGKKFLEIEKSAPSIRPERQSSTEVITTNSAGDRLSLHMKETPADIQNELPIHLVRASETSGHLWEPRTNRKQELQLFVNEDHDFYQKVMLPASKEAFAGYVALFMAFSKAELATQYSQFKMQFQHMRRHMSETLEEYCADLPMPDLSGVDE